MWSVGFYEGQQIRGWRGFRSSFKEMKLSRLSNFIWRVLVNCLTLHCDRSGGSSGLGADWIKADWQAINQRRQTTVIKKGSRQAGKNWNKQIHKNQGWTATGTRARQTNWAGNYCLRAGTYTLYIQYIPSGWLGEMRRRCWQVRIRWLGNGRSIQRTTGGQAGNDRTGLNWIMAGKIKKSMMKLSLWHPEEHLVFALICNYYFMSSTWPVLRIFRHVSSLMLGFTVFSS